MNEATYEIVKLVVSVVATLVGLYLVPYIHRKTNALKDDEAWKEALKAVKAVEQKVKESGMGKAKKAEVLAYVAAWLNEKNIKITGAQLDNLIEAAVYCMNHPQGGEDGNRKAD